MNNYCLLFLTALFFACSEKSNDEIYQGKLEELIVGDLIIKKDSLTKGIEVRQVINHEGHDYVVSLADRERTIQYYSIHSGDKVKEVKLPFDGPNGFRGYVGMLIAEGMDSLTLISLDGWYYFYYKNQREKVEQIDSRLEFPNSYYSSIYYDRRKNFTKVSKSLYQIAVSPLIRPVSNFSGKTKAFDKIEKWMINYYPQENKASTQTIPFPSGYRLDFLEDHLSYPPIVEFVGNRNYVLFPYSDSVFVLSDYNVIEKKVLRSQMDFNFSGSETVVREEYGFLELKKDASSHLDLLYDTYRDVFIRISKIKESGNGETTRERAKHYLVSVFDSDLNTLSEYTIEYGQGSRLENYFIASEGLFINKPEQTSEDEYEFYKIDLSRFAD